MVNTRGSAKQAPTDSGMATTSGDQGHIVMGQPASPTDPLNESIRTIVEAPQHEQVQSANSIIVSTRTRRTASSRTIQKRRETELAAAEKLAALERDRLYAESSAAEKLAALERDRLQAELAAAKRLTDIEKDLVQRKLQADLDAIEDEGSVISEENENRPVQPGDAANLISRQRTEQWIETTARPPLPPRSSHLAAAARRATEEPPVYETHAAVGQTHEGQDGGMAQLAKAITALATRPDRYTSQLPEYNGTSADWLAYKAAYDEQKHRFNAQENLARLRKSLRGEAKAAVCHQLIGKGDPDDVITTLGRRFGRAEYIIDGELQALRDLPKLTDVPKQINLFACRVQNTVAALRALEEEEYLRNMDVVCAVKNKMQLLMIPYMDFAYPRLNDGQPELVKISDFLTRESDKISLMWRTARERDTTAAPRPAPPQQPRGSAAGRGAAAAANRPAQRHVVHAATADTDSATPTCSLCATTEHKLHLCKKFIALNNDEKWKHIRNAGLCFRCLKHGHRAAFCKGKIGCSVTGCGRRHHTVLHEDRPLEHSACATSENREIVMKADSGDGRALLKILPVTLYGPEGSARTYALLDDGSTVTLMKSQLAAKIGADGPTEPITIAGVTACSTVPNSKRVSVTIAGADGDEFLLRNARTVDRLKLCTQTVENFAQLPHLRDVPIERYTKAEPEILIGQDNWHLLLSSEWKHGQIEEPVASHTPLGWVLHGGHTGGSRQTVHFVGHAAHDDDTDALIRHHFKIEALGVTPIEKRRPQDERALDILEKTCRRTENEKRWEAGLLWREQVVTMPSSKGSALKRLRTLEKRMDSDRDFGNAYCKQMDHLISNGYAALAPTHVTTPKQWYLPHFAVVNPNKPGKLRIVFDAAARVGGKSLNDALLTGPDLLSSLLGVLYKFREGKYAVSADICEMFLRVQIEPSDRHAQRFLWRGWARDTPPQEFEMRSMIFGAASSPTTAIYIKNRNARELADTYPEAARSIERNFYMDDYLESFSSEERAIENAQQVARVNAEGGFVLTSWASNSDRVLRRLDSTRRVQERSLDLQTNYEKTLGLRWDPRADTLGFNLNTARVPSEIATGSKRPTKRQMLSMVMSVFDPLGLLAPIIIQAKVILQKVWRSGIEWDDVLADREADLWEEWLRRLRESWTCRVPRCYCARTNVVDVQLHIFCDASEDAYAAVAYFRFTLRDGSAHTSLVGSKSRVTPLKPVSIPRLELQAALLGSRLAATICAEHTIRPARKVFWTDSRTVLAWITGDPRAYKPFVAHRLGEIDELSDASDWRWVPTAQNVADDATRALPALSTEHRWFHGPEFLRERESEWPAQPKTRAAECTEELRSAPPEVVAAATAVAVKATHLPEVTRFSSWTRLLRATAYVLLFVDQCRRRHKGELEMQHIRKAESLWYIQIQRDSFAMERECLEAGRAIPSASRLQQLSPYLDSENVLRLRGRASAAPDIDRRATQPVILCGRHPATRLLVQHLHVKFHHASPEAVVNELRQTCWVVHLRPTVRAVASACQVCRLRRATACSPPMGDLPEARLGHHHRPFTYCGLDYFGPLDVAVGRRREKRYCALFTCLVTRAVHLEIAASLSTDSAIAALRRLVARRGAPSYIYSDNGTNFHGADAELRRAWAEVDIDAVKTFALTRGAEWRFIPPAAPFMGGAWERLVGSVRRALRATLHQRAPSDEVLATLLAEAEHTINARPLTHVSVDPSDPEALTPNHFLLGSSSAAPTPGTFDDSDLVRRRQWRATQRLADVFWSRWVREYLPTLLPRKLPGDSADELREGDVVLIVDANLPRNVWPRGVIERTLPGKDGHVRVVDVRTVGGTLRRPARKIVRLPVQRVVGEPANDRGENVNDGR